MVQNVSSLTSAAARAYAALYRNGLDPLISRANLPDIPLNDRWTVEAVQRMLKAQSQAATKVFDA